MVLARIITIQDRWFNLDQARLSWLELTQYLGPPICRMFRTPLIVYASFPPYLYAISPKGADWVRGVSISNMGVFESCGFHALSVTKQRVHILIMFVISKRVEHDASQYQRSSKHLGFQGIA